MFNYQRVNHTNEWSPTRPLEEKLGQSLGAWLLTLVQNNCDSWMFIQNYQGKWSVSSTILRYLRCRWCRPFRCAFDPQGRWQRWQLSKGFCSRWKPREPEFLTHLPSCKHGYVLFWEMLPSGKRLQKAIENGHRNSGFTWIYPLKMVDLSSSLCNSLPGRVPCF
jgi:hypothetical protein